MNYGVDMIMTPDSTYRALLNREPTDYQRYSLDNYPKYKGVYLPHKKELIEAYLVLALCSGHYTDRVYWYTPGHTRGEVIETIRALVIEILSPYKRPGGLKYARGIEKLIGKLYLGANPLTVGSEPIHWVSTGFRDSDALPTWMRPKLLKLPNEI